MYDFTLGTINFEICLKMNTKSNGYEPLSVLYIHLELSLKNMGIIILGKIHHIIKGYRISTPSTFEFARVVYPSFKASIRNIRGIFSLVIC